MTQLKQTAHLPGVDAPPLDIDAMAADAMARINKYINYSSAAHLRAILKTLRAADHHDSKKVPQQANPALHFARRAKPVCLAHGGDGPTAVER